MKTAGLVLFADVNDPWRCAPPTDHEALAWWLLRREESTMRYRKKPVEVEAVRWTGQNVEELQAFAGERFEHLDLEDREDDADAGIFDVLHSTWVKVYPGQWVIKGVAGEFYPCAHDVFQQTYEPVLVAST